MWLGIPIRAAPGGSRRAQTMGSGWAGSWPGVGFGGSDCGCQGGKRNGYIRNAAGTGMAGRLATSTERTARDDQMECKAGTMTD